MIPNRYLSWVRFSGTASLYTVSFLTLAISLFMGALFWVCQSAEPVKDEATPATADEVVLHQPQTGLPEAHIALGTRVYRIEVASTPEQAETGLMYRTNLPEGHGMLFPFTPPRPVSFWMKNTLIPLDILFIAKGNLQHVFENAQPCLADPCPTYGVPALTDMVLELPAGTARRDHLVVGATAQVRWPVAIKQPPSHTESN